MVVWGQITSGHWVVSDPDIIYTKATLAEICQQLCIQICRVSNCLGFFLFYIYFVTRVMWILPPWNIKAPISICQEEIQFIQTFLPSLQQSYSFVHSQLTGRAFSKPRRAFYSMSICKLWLLACVSRRHHMMQTSYIRSDRFLPWDRWAFWWSLTSSCRKGEGSWKDVCVSPGAISGESG